MWPWERHLIHHVPLLPYLHIFQFFLNGDKTSLVCIFFIFFLMGNPKAILPLRVIPIFRYVPLKCPNIKLKSGHALVTLLVCIPQKIRDHGEGRSCSSKKFSNLGICENATHSLCLLSSLISLRSTHKILVIKCLEPLASSPLSRIVQGQKLNFFFLRLMQEEKKIIFPQLTFSHVITLFQERCKNPNSKKGKKHKLFNSQSSF